MLNVHTHNYFGIVEDIIESYFTNLNHWKFNVIQQFYDVDKEAPYAELSSMGVIEFLEKWCKWRITIELEALKHRKAKKLVAIDLQNLLILAASNIDIIMASLKRKDTEDYLGKKLKITPEQVDTILSRQIKTLKALNLIDMKSKLASLKQELKEIEGMIKKPADTVVADIEILEKKIA